MNNKQPKPVCTTNLPSDYTVIDLETTGLSPHHNDIIEFAALKIRNDRVVDEFSELVKPGIKVKPFISSLTGITNDMLKKASYIIDVLPSYAKFLGDDIVIGHNVTFDVNFINAKMLWHFDKEFKNNYIDTLRLSRLHCPIKSHKLNLVADYFDIDSKGHHRGLADCEMTYEIYKRLKECALYKV